jgi:hypothetical protein
VNEKLELYFGDFFHGLDSDDEGTDNRGNLWNSFGISRLDEA